MQGLLRLFRLWYLPAFLAVLSVSFGCRHEPGAPAAGREAVQGRGEAAPAYVLEVLTYVRQNDRAPEGFVGGRSFQNRERLLPQRTPENQAIRYREWDVHPKVPGQNRGPERLVTGSDRTAWFTRDHYKSFQRIE